MFKSYICTSCVSEETQRWNGILLHTVVSKIVTGFELSAHICGMMSALQFLSWRTAACGCANDRRHNIGTPRVYLNQILINNEHLTDYSDSGCAMCKMKRVPNKFSDVTCK